MSGVVAALGGDVVGLAVTTTGTVVTVVTVEAGFVVSVGAGPGRDDSWLRFGDRGRRRADRGRRRADRRGRRA